jgi:hypothetical protein
VIPETAIPETEMVMATEMVTVMATVTATATATLLPS